MKRRTLEDSKSQGVLDQAVGVRAQEGVGCRGAPSRYEACVNFGATIYISASPLPSVLDDLQSL